MCDASVGLVALEDAKAVLCPRSETNGSAAFAGGSDPKGRLCWVPLCGDHEGVYKKVRRIRSC